jgi:hypothetical protein
MSRLTDEQIAALVQQAGGIVAILNPATGAAASALAQLAVQTFIALRNVEANSPDLWNEVSADSKDAIAGFRAAVAARGTAG